MSDSYTEDMDRMWRSFWLAIGSVVLAFILFATFVLAPSYAERQEACEAKGGVIVGKYGDCIKREQVL